MFDWFFSFEAWMSLATLTGLEIVLGIDNIIFIAILCQKLPKYQQNKGRILGLAFALITRIILLLTLFWIMKLTKPLFNIGSIEISGRDLILIIGGIFLLVKSGAEIIDSINHKVHVDNKNIKHASFLGVIIQIGILDIVFSLDSVITAVGMAQHIEIMIIAVIIAVLIMMLASGSISIFIEKNPTIKILALAFLILVGVSLILEGFEIHIPKGYIYFSMGFSLFVELINIQIRKNVNKNLS